MDRALAEIIEAKYQQCVARVIHRLRRVKSDAWQGSDAPERTLWDHWKREVQDEHSDIHDLLESHVEAVARDVIDALPSEDGQLMTMATRWFERHGDEQGEAVNCPEEVMAELMNRVNHAAGEEPHRKSVQRQRDAVAIDRLTRDTEQHQQ